MLHIYAALAEKERRNISIRTKQALAAAKARGVRLGNAEQAKLNKHEADRYAETVRPILIELRHLPVEKIADELTKRMKVCSASISGVIFVRGASNSPRA
jgi:DNA invertase Pin-like site-specific DNA recombinase